MMIRLILIMGNVLGLLAKPEEKSQWDFYQNDYDVVMDRALVADYNKTYLKDVKGGYVFFNRTQKALNASFHLSMDITKDFTLEAQFYKFMSNEYRFFPVTFSINICEEYKRDSLGSRTLLDKTSNIRSCPLKKGFYYIGYLLPDFSRCPPYIPRGGYKLSAKFYHKTDFFMEGQAFGSVVDKPMNWKA